ncbi:MAG TPA: hypothetical protein VFZ61_25450, partial [Polyangiales bacterium]
RRVRMDDWATRALTSPHAKLVIFCFAMLLTSSYLALSGTGDDDFHAVAARANGQLPSVHREAWDLFAFATPATNQAMVEDGIFPWWTDPQLTIAFYRPLSSLTTWLDHRFWPERPALMHLHSMLWFALLLGSVTLVYRALSLSSRHAALALFFYAVDDARSMPVAWLAQRNALIALAPAFLSLLAHHRFRQTGRARFALLGVTALAVGFQGGESALSVCGYLIAYALTFDEKGTLARRLLALWPYLTTVVLWRIVYVMLERGAMNSGIYIDPGRDPLVFLRHLCVRLPVLLLGQFALPFSDLWEAYPLIASWLRPTVLCMAVLVLYGLWTLLRPLLREHKLLRFWLVGCVLATIPVCGVHPEDRMLTATSLGSAQLIASFVLSVLDASYPRRSLVVLSSGALLLVIHGLFAPLTLPLRSFDIYAMERLMRHSDRSIPHGPQAKQQTVVLINPPVDVFAIYFSVYRASRQLELPGHLRWLATGESELEVARVDEHSLKLRPALGYLATATQLMFRRPDRPITSDQIIRLDGVSYQVTEQTSDGRPAELLVRFDRPLESPEFRWLQWGKHEYVPFTLPAVGQRVVLPKADLGALFENPAG